MTDLQNNEFAIDRPIVNPANKDLVRFLSSELKDGISLPYDKDWICYATYDRVLNELKRIVFWREGDLTCEQEVELLLHRAGRIESKDRKVLSKANKEVENYECRTTRLFQ